ncbi:MAG TPA: (deoxy)nucleoside triphosphate pyrophosphohydrolase [Erysipelothrix sp.]|jgi:8-oxo-dGTP diphosphatase|nr:(deoxy)nucleoside triphosphate pyrophosphohydrolase [Erysipelothrix sp.]
MKKIIKVVGALIVKDNQVLIAQRKNGEFDSLWEFPGGKIEDLETPQDALAREIYEEFEAKIKVENFIVNVFYTYPNFILDMDCFLCSIIDNSNIKLHDHHKVKWISLDTPVNEIDWVPADIEVYEGLQEHFRSL